jgi:hypothetical protein
MKNYVEHRKDFRGYICAAICGCMTVLSMFVLVAQSHPAQQGTWEESRSEKSRLKRESGNDLCEASYVALGLHLRSIMWLRDCAVDVRARGTVTARSAGTLGRITFPKEQNDTESGKDLCRAS